MILLEQPRNIQNVTELAYNLGEGEKPPIPEGKIGVVLWGDPAQRHYYLTSTDSTSIGKRTGFQTSQPNHQLATMPKWPCSTAIQAYGDTVGINIETFSNKKNLASRNNLGTIVLAGNFPKVSPALIQKRIKFSFDMAVPTAVMFGGATTQVSTHLSFRDAFSKQSFWFGVTVYDKMRAAGNTLVFYDKNTSSGGLNVNMGSTAGVVDFSLPTASYSASPYSDWRSYQYVIGATQIAAAARVMNTRRPTGSSQIIFSEDPEHYTCSHANINPEICVPPGIFSYAQIGCKVRNWRVELV